MAPRTEYARRVGELSEQRAQLDARGRAAGYAQLALAALTIVWVLLRLRHLQKIDLFILIPVMAFILLAVLHERWIRAAALRSRSIRFYEQGLARLNDTWPGTGNTGEHFIPLSDLCARDLDLFGRASVFELLCTARTRAGEQALARWLLTAAAPDEVRARQAAAKDLSTRLDFREDLAIAGEDVQLGVHPVELVAWGEANDFFSLPGMRILLPVLALAWVLSVLAWQIWNLTGFVVLATTVINLGISYYVRHRLNHAAHATEQAGHDLALLAGVLRAFENEKFSSPRLLELQAKLQPHLHTAGHPKILASKAITRLNMWVEYLESAHSLFVRVIDFVVFYRLQLVLAAESWRRQFGPSLRVWLGSVGELEALAALAAYTYEHPEDVFPVFVEDSPCFQAEGLAHPLIPRERAVQNDLHLTGDLQLLMVSGPNMAGKSTFMRGIGVNAVLAQCGAPVRASSLKLSPLTVTASIRVQDSLEEGISRFYAEINRIKQILDLTSGSVAVLFLLDELLSGTNSHDRLIGTQSIVVKLVEKGAIGLVSTHDLALTAIPEGIGSKAVNCHFEDHLEAGKLAFDYKLYPGVVQTSNALTLMRSIGIDV